VAVHTGFDLAAGIGWARHCCSGLGYQVLDCCCCYSSHVAAPGRTVDLDLVAADTKAEVGLVRPAITSVYVRSANGIGECVAQQVVEDTMRSWCTGDRRTDLEAMAMNLSLSKSM
jgi:hypothetical protein